VIHSYHMSKPAESSFTEYVVHTVLSSSDSDLFIAGTPPAYSYFLIH